MLLIQTNRRLRPIFLLIIEPEKLPVIFPIPTGIGHVGEAFTFDLVRDFVEGRENIGRRRALRAETFLFRQTQSANARENFQPGQEQPAERADYSPDKTSGDEVNGKKRRDQNPKRTGLLRERSLVTAQSNAEHEHAQRHEKTKKHYGSIWCWRRKLFQLIGIKIRQHFIARHQRRNVALIG